jgi:NAD-dependent dihydropyrimidine dehydrogenase PreA subunit
MSIERIDAELCNGCGICVDSCPMDVLRMDEKGEKAVIKYPDDCMACCYCERECPQNAIYVSPELLVRPLLSWG